MDYILEHKVRFVEETESTLYKWSLVETDSSGTPLKGAWIRFPWSLWFTAKQLSVVTGFGFDGDDRSDAVDFTHSKIIVGSFLPGLSLDGQELDNVVEYSFFGTNRKVSEFHVSISKSDDDTESCRVYARPSYESEGADFLSEIEPDYVGIDVVLNEERFSNFVALIEAKQIDSARFRVGFMDGIYSHWTPTIFSRSIKILSDEVDVEGVREGFELSRVGSVGNFDFSIASTLRLFDGDPVRSAQGDPEDSNKRNLSEESIPVHGLCMGKTLGVLEGALRRIKVVMWLIFFTLILILIK